MLDGALRNGFGNTSPAVANALPWVCGSMTSAALYAFEHQVNTFSPTSGAHHAHYGFGHGFCTFNFLVLAALLAHRAGAQKVGIVDCDMHHGDGTEDIIKKCRFKFIQHYSFSLSGRGRSQDDTSFIDAFSESLQDLRDCDLIIYNAGADPHVDDPLGGELTTEEMRMRDFVLFLCMKKFAIPVVTSLAGGYQRDSQGSIQPVLELHNNTLKECYRVMREY